MKKLIENNIAKEYIAKSSKFINKQIQQPRDKDSELDTHNQQFLQTMDLQLQSQCQSKYNSKKLSNKNIIVCSKSKQGKQNKVTIKQKYNMQQVSSLYAQHIYKSNQRDYILEAQLEKYKLMLENQKKQKMQLLAQQNQWKNQRLRLLEQKQIILFALDSLTVKFDSQQQMKNNRQMRRQTSQVRKSKLYGNQVLSGFHKPGSQRQQNDQNSLASIVLTPSREANMNSSWQKMKLIRNLKQKLNISNSADVTNIMEENQRTQNKIHQLEEVIKEANKKIQSLQATIQRQYSQAQKKTKVDYQIYKQLQQETIQLKQKISKLQQQLNNQQQANFNLKQSITFLQGEQELYNKEKGKMQQKITLLQKQLKITQEQYSQREQREKQCVKTLQKFTQDLKLGDQKIQSFLKNEVPNYEQNNSQDISRTTKSYNQHISYILHLCKKKQNVYEQIVAELKQKIKEDDFRASILEKKLNNLSKYHQSLRSLAQSQAAKEVLYRTILRFGN